MTHTVQVMREQIKISEVCFINKQLTVSSEHHVSTELRELIITQLHSYATCKVCNTESANIGLPVATTQLQYSRIIQ